MGDNTPKVKSKSGSLTSKYLTPCRTFGLKRKSTPKSAIVKIPKTENINPLASPVLVDSPVSRKIQRQISPLNVIKTEENIDQITPLKPVNHLSTPKLIKDEEKTPLRTVNKFILKLNPENSVDNNLLAEHIKRINDKINRIEKLKQEEIYTKKHNLIELKKSTDKWMESFKLIALDLHRELQEKGRQCSLLDILVDHNIPPERVGFNVENLDFD